MQNTRTGSTKVLPSRPTDSESFHVVTFSMSECPETCDEKANQKSRCGLKPNTFKFYNSIGKSNLIVIGIHSKLQVNKKKMFALLAIFK